MFDSLENVVARPPARLYSITVFVVMIQDWVQHCHLQPFKLLRNYSTFHGNAVVSFSSAILHNVNSQLTVTVFLSLFPNSQRTAQHGRANGVWTPFPIFTLATKKLENHFFDSWWFINSSHQSDPLASSLEQRARRFVVTMEIKKC